MNEFQDYIDDDILTDEQREDQRLALLSGFAATLAEKLKDAIDYRKESGIEDIWLEDEEFFNGIDDANRADKQLKPATMDGRVTSGNNRKGNTRSNIFVNITKPYCKMGKSRVAEMLLPSEDKPFSIDPSPIPEIVSLKNSQDMMPGGQHSVGQAAAAFVEQAEKCAGKAETQIWDWLSESNYHTEMRKVIDQTVKIGVGILKGPFPIMRKYRRADKRDDGTLALVIEERLSPCSEWIDAWNFYPDPGCGENIHDGGHTFERKLLTGKKLRELRGTGYIDSEINKVLKEGPAKTRRADTQRDHEKADKEKYELFYYHGEAKAGEYAAARYEDSDDTDEMINVLVVMVNDHIIKASMNPLDSGEFPYDVMCWERISGFWAGEGVSRQVRSSQRIGNAAVRNMMDNAGVSAGPQIILRKGVVTPVDGSWGITPLKLWEVDEDADVNDVRAAITSVVIPTMQAELAAVLKMALDLAERATNMPLIMQGQQGAATETVGGMEILQTNSSSVLRDIASTFDDSLVKPHIIRYYEWLMLYGDDEEAKGDFVIQPQGSTAFYERDAQNEFILKIAPMANDPEFGLDKKKIMEEMLKANKISPSRVQYSDAEMKAHQEERAKNPPVLPAVQAAQIRVEGDLKKAELESKANQAEVAGRTDEFQQEAALKLQLASEEHQNRMDLAQLQKELKMMELSQAQGISLDKIKADLAGTTMKLTTQKQLSDQALQVEAANTDKSHAHDRATQIIEHSHAKNLQASTPPTEPAGRAPNNQSYAL